VTDPDRQRIGEWIGDAFAILCVRVGGISAAERKLRLSFEAILRELGSSPLSVLARATPSPLKRMTASPADLRHIVKSLDACVRIFARYENVLTRHHRQIYDLVRAARRFAEEELQTKLKPAAPRLASQLVDTPLAATTSAPAAYFSLNTAVTGK
jgi:hypothetical protein